MRLRNIFRRNKHLPVKSNVEVVNDEVVTAQEKHARRYGVISAVHSDDHIFRFCLEHDCFEGQVDNAVGYYFDTSAESATKLMSICAENAPEMGQDFELLEFASGYGAVTRHLKNILPEAIVTACDIHPQAIRFMAEKLRCGAIQSTSKPADFVLGQSFDVVFALSFFSHMPEVTWRPWLQALSNHVKSGGLLIFTTHGKASLKHLGNPQCDARGYWFKADSEQLDLRTAEYGLTVTLPGFVKDALNNIPELEVLEVREAYWWEHQDTYVARKR